MRISANASTASAEIDPAMPVTAPRRVLPTVLPRMSLKLTEQNDRLTARPPSARAMATPATQPESVRAARTISAAQIPCPAEPATQAHLRCRIACTRPASTICGKSAPASRMGTKSPTIPAGTPKAPPSQLSTSLGSISPSASLVIVRLVAWRNPLRASRASTSLAPVNPS